jgi:uncharacterized membrane protein
MNLPPPPAMPPHGYNYWVAPPARRDNAGVASLILGVIGLLTSVLCVGTFFGIAAVVLGFVSRSRAWRDGQSSPVKAIVGIVLGLLSMIVGLGLLVLFVWLENQYQNSGECWPFKDHAGCY